MKMRKIKNYTLLALLYFGMMVGAVIFMWLVYRFLWAAAEIGMPM